MPDETAAPQSPQERTAGFLALMRNRNYALLWSGQLVSEMGNRLHWVAVSLWVYSLTKSAAAVSLAVSSMFVGTLLVSLWAGVIVDRLDRRRILIVTDLVRAALTAAIPVLILLDIRLLYVDLILISIASAFFRPAVFSVVPAVVDRQHLLPANSFFSAMDTATEIGGPVLAGLLAQRFGYAFLLYADAATYVVSSLCVVAMSFRSKTDGRTGLGLTAIWRGVGEGLRYIRRDSLQWGLFILIFPSTLVGSGLNALQTPLAKGIVVITDAQFGTFQSVWGGGFLIASLLLGWHGARLRKSSLILGGFFLGFASTALMGLSRSLEHLLAAAFAVGFANTLYFVGIGTVLMEYTPSNLVGRVVSTRQLALGLVRVASPLAFGGLAEVIGVRVAIVAMAGLGAVGTAMVAGLSPAIRRFDSVPADSAQRRSVLKLFTEPVDSDLDERQQKRMNMLTMSLGLIALAVLTYRSPFGALGLFLLIFGVAYGGMMSRRIGRR